MKVTITGADKLVAALLKAQKEVSKELRKGVKEAFGVVQAKAVSDSGYIKRSGNLDRNIIDPNNIEVSNSGLRGKLKVKNTTNVPYAYIQHEGGRGIKPKKYLTRAMKSSEKQVVKILNESINNAIKKAGL